MPAPAWGKMVVRGCFAYTEHYEWAHRSSRAFLVLSPPHVRHKIRMPAGHVGTCRGDPAKLTLLLYTKPRRPPVRWALASFSRAIHIGMGPGWQGRLARVLAEYDLPVCQGILDFVGNRPLPPTTGKDHEYAFRWR